MLMNLIISKSKNSKSLYIQKSFRKNGKSTSKVVKKLGTMEELLPKHNNSEDEVIAWGKKIAKKMTEEEKRDKDIVLISLSQSKLLEPMKQTSYNGGYLFLQDIFHSLKLDKICRDIQDEYKFEYDLADVLSRLIYSRIIYPSSKLSAFEDSKNFIEQPTFELHDIYRSLDVLAEKCDTIQEFLYENSKKVVNRNASVLYYDCTNYFFEIEEERGNCRYGKSKEHRSLPIIQMGLLMDGNGFPLSFVIFPGNENEQPSLIPVEKKIIKDFGITKFVVCTDAGLASKENREFNIQKNCSYIVTQSLKKIKKHIKDWALNPEGWSKGDSTGLDISSVMKAVDDGETFEDGIWYKERWINENGIEQRIIVSFSPKYRAYQRYIRSRQIERARKSAESNKKTTTKNPNSPSRFLDEVRYTDNGEVADNVEVVVNDGRIAEEEKYDGFYAVCTTLEDDIKDIIKVNKRRWEIEESFKIMKSEFKARPVYLQKDNRIEAHFLTCFIALMFIRILENKTGNKLTIEKLIDTLREYNFYHYEGSGYVPTYTRNDATDILHEAFGFRTDYQINGEKNMKKIIKNTKTGKY
jgi:Transposase